MGTWWFLTKSAKISSFKVDNCFSGEIAQKIYKSFRNRPLSFKSYEVGVTSVEQASNLGLSVCQVLGFVSMKKIIPKEIYLKAIHALMMLGIVFQNWNPTDYSFFISGVEKLVHYLLKCNIPVAVASGSAKKDFVTKHLDIIFSSIKHTDQVEREVKYI